MRVCGWVCLHFLDYLRSLPTVYPVPAALGLNSAVLLDKSIYDKFLNLSTIDTWVCVIVMGAVQCILGCLVASLTSSHKVPVAP